jgi:hypothetical protein
MDDLKKVAQAFVQAANLGGPTSYIPEVTDYSRAASFEGAVKQGLAGSGSLAGQRAQEADAADKAAREARMRELSDKLDPSKYRRERKADGGYAFFAPDGKEIGIDQYAQVTGLRLADILKDSENPIDQEFVNDWSNMNSLMQSMYNGDQSTIDAFVQQNPQLKDMKPQDLMTELIRKYPHLYGRGSYQQTLSNRGTNAFRYNPNALVTSDSSSGGGWSPS